MKTPIPHLALHVLLAAERTGVLGVLCDLHLFHRLTEGGTVPGLSKSQV